MKLKKLCRWGGPFAALALALVFVPSLIAGNSEVAPAASQSFLFTVCVNSACRAIGGNCICLSGFAGVTCRTHGTSCNVVVPDCEDDNIPAAAC